MDNIKGHYSLDNVQLADLHDLDDGGDVGDG